VWHETPGWAQQGSFVQPVPIPTAAIDDAPQVCVQVNVEWLPYVLGSLMQLVQPSSWIAPTQAALDDVLERATDLIGEIGNAVVCSCPILRLHDCVLQISCDAGVTWTDATDWTADFQACVAANVSPPVPANPAGTTTGFRACNIAAYLAKQVLQAAAAAQAANRASVNDQNSLIHSLINDVFHGSPLITGIVDASYGLFVTSQSFPNTDLVTASTDAGLLLSLSEAIFGGSNGTGYVDAGNFATIATNIAAITYPSATWVPVMLANFWTHLTLATIQSMQSIGALTDADCSAFVTPVCIFHDFSVSDQGWTAESGAGAYGTAGFGAGWYQQVVSGTKTSLRIHSPVFAAGFVLTAVKMTIAGANPNTHGNDRTVYVQNPCSVTNVGSTAFTDSGFGGASVLTVAVTSSAAARCMVIDYDSDTGPFASGMIRDIQLIGTGVNPAGVNNCPP
jgi:hypothetical protein